MEIMKKQKVNYWKKIGFKIYMKKPPSEYLHLAVYLSHSYWLRAIEEKEKKEKDELKDKSIKCYLRLFELVTNKSLDETLKDRIYVTLANTHKLVKPITILEEVLISEGLVKIVNAFENGEGGVENFEESLLKFNEVLTKKPKLIYLLACLGRYQESILNLGSMEIIKLCISMR